MSSLVKTKLPGRQCQTTADERASCQVGTSRRTAKLEDNDLNSKSQTLKPFPAFVFYDFNICYISVANILHRLKSGIFYRGCSFTSGPINTSFFFFLSALLCSIYNFTFFTFTKTSGLEVNLPFQLMANSPLESISSAHNLLFLKLCG